MRHRKLNRRFGRNRSGRKALMRSLVRALFISYRIETTVEKAKAARALAEKLITLSKKATLADIRMINSVLNDRALTKKLIKEVSPLFKDKSSGYTRVIRTGFRKGDGAGMAILELTQRPAAIEKKPKKEKKEKPAVQTEKPEKAAKIEQKPPEVLPPKEKKPIPKEEAAPPPPEKESRKEKKPAEEKKGLFGRLKRFFKKDR